MLNAADTLSGNYLEAVTFCTKSDDTLVLLREMNNSGFANKIHPRHSPAEAAANSGNYCTNTS